MSDGPRAIDVFAQCLELDETDTISTEALEVLYEELSQWDELVDLLEQRADITYDNAVLVDILAKLGLLLREHTNDGIRATATYERILEIDESSHDARIVLGSCIVSTSWVELQDILLYELTEADTELMRGDLLGQLADLALGKLDQREQGIDYLRQAHEIDPASVDLTQRLDALLRNRERWYDLVEILESHCQALEDAEPQIVVDILVELGRLSSQHLRDADKAIEYFNRVLVTEPENVGALTGLAELYQQNGEWREPLRCWTKSWHWLRGRNGILFGA